MAALLVLILTIGLGGCGERIEIPREEAYWEPHPLLMKAPFVQGSETRDDVSCGMSDCAELEPWLSPSFLACQGDPEAQDPPMPFGCYFAEYRRQLAAVRTAEQKLYAQLPAAEAKRLRDAQRAWAEAEKLVTRKATYGWRGSMHGQLYVWAQADYAVRRRIDLETRLGLAPSPPPEAPKDDLTLEEAARAMPPPED
ncbi:MAG TPA: lysozyme inhibitor LprI family protein [Caulobacter sp.]|nr:lysozyme inhibitor LprI family protein [Caulobacter sp.]